MTTLPIKTIMQPSGDTLTTSGNATLLLPKLPQPAKQAYRISGLTNNLLCAATLADAGCEVFFHQTPNRVTHNEEIILRGWHDPITRLWQVPLQSDEENIAPHDPNILLSTEPTAQTNSIYECKNTHQLINFYYATMGYPSPHAINQGYFQGWTRLTSTRVWHFVKPLEYNLMGHLDQRRQGIRSTKSHSVTTIPDPMEELQQLTLNDKTNMVFMTMVNIQGHLFTDQTGRCPLTSNRGNNYVVIIYTVDENHIKSYPIKSCHRSELLHAYNNVYTYLREQGYQP
ncbi:LOW QUALITY PROTEIN: hypothetical protein ACHAW6_005291 [Cyclotella cf. meneghiniana]